MAPPRKGGGRTSAAAGTSRGARVPASSRVAVTAAVPPDVTALTAERDQLKRELKQARARLSRLEARESVVQDHLTRAIATIDRLLAGA